MGAADMPERLADLQTAFAGHIRSPDTVPAPDGIEDRRMQIYRDLFFNNISRLLASNFPVLRRLYDSKGWAGLIREFYIEHRAQTPLFPELPREFLRYAEEHRAGRPGDPPFLLELAHYEWVELALSLDERELEDIAVERNGDLLAGVPVLSPLAWPLSYRYPVHRIGPDYRPQEAPAEMTHLLVYRNRSDKVRFMQLNDVARLLLALMQEQPDLTGSQLLELTAARIDHPDPPVVIRGGKQLMLDLLARDVLLGARRNTTRPHISE
jgi:hypothetical protein